MNELFCALLCTAFVHNHAYSYDQLLQVNSVLLVYIKFFWYFLSVVFVCYEFDCQFQCNTLPERLIR